MSDMDRPVTIDDIRAAAERLRGVALATPLVPFMTPDGRLILLKAESLQPIGAFKIRGATTPSHGWIADRVARVVASSSGNHGQGVARAARLLGVPATVFMPADATAMKLERVRADGAEVITVDPLGPVTNQEAARAYGETHGIPFIHSYDNDDVIAGQGGRARDRGGGRRPWRAARAGRGAGSSAGWPPLCGRSTPAHGSSASNPRGGRRPGVVPWRGARCVAARTEPSHDRRRSPHEPRAADLRPYPAAGRRHRHRRRSRDRRGRPAAGRACRLVVEPTGALAVRRRRSVPPRQD